MGLLRRLPIQPPSPMGARLKLFISHSWRYGEDRKGVHNLLEREWRKGEDFIDLSVPADHPIHDADEDGELFDKLRDLIAQADVLLVLGGMYANSSNWIETEIAIARGLKKPVITVVPYGQERVASVATRFQHDEVSWRGDLIRAAILRWVPSKAAEIQHRVEARNDAFFLALWSAMQAGQTMAIPRAPTGASSQRRGLGSPRYAALGFDAANPSNALISAMSGNPFPRRRG